MSALTRARPPRLPDHWREQATDADYYDEITIVREGVGTTVVGVLEPLDAAFSPLEEAFFAEGDALDDPEAQSDPV